MKGWKKLERNEVLEGKDFYISYNSCPGTGILMFMADNGGDETALVDIRDGKSTFYILNGDFRKEYEKAFSGGFKKCFIVYSKHKKAANSSWSTLKEENK